MILWFIVNSKNWINLKTHSDLFLFYSKWVFFIVRGKRCGGFYRCWLGQHGPCCNTNMRPSFLKTRPSFSNTRPSFWFSLKASKARPSVWKARLSVWKVRPCVLQQTFGRVFRYRNFMKIWSVKSTVCSLESSVINLFNLNFINNICSYSLRH